MKGLVLDRLAIRLDGRPLVALDAAIAPGEVLSVMGPSGVGKSTLLAALAGLLDPAFELDGRILIDGQDVTGLPAETRRMGLMFQDPLLFPHLSVGGNLKFGMPRGVKDRTGTAARALAEAGLEDFAARDPATLSGGQKARVALLRVLLSEPRAMLLDEPFSGLDAALRQDIRAFVFARIRDRGLPCLLVTHDAADAHAAGGRVIELTG